MNAETFWNQNTGNLSFFKKWLGSKVNKLTTPDIVRHCKGLNFKDKKIYSILFSTDLAVIENNDCDAVLAVYPFPPSQKIIETLISFSEKPVICGVGGGITKGNKALEMAKIAEEAGAFAVIVNQPFNNKDIMLLKKHLNIPIISSIYTLDFDFEKRIQAGVSIFHVTGGIETQDITNYLRDYFPEFPYICTGGKTFTHLQKAVESGASAVVLSPPSNGDLFKNIMKNYRSNVSKMKKGISSILFSKR